jgi:Tfp pilus assembly protein PilF
VRKRPRKPGKPQLLNAAALRRENRKKGEIEATFSASMDYALFQLAQGKLGTAKTFMVQALAIEEKSARAQRGMIMVAAASKQSKLARGHIHTFLNLPDAPDDTPLVRRMSQFIGKPEVCLGK